jgi:hypothetical protein
MADSTLYDTDITGWATRKAALLRRRAAGELVNDAELDWTNIAEEIEDVGARHRLRALAEVAIPARHAVRLRSSAPSSSTPLRSRRSSPLTASRAPSSPFGCPTGA